MSPNNHTAFEQQDKHTNDLENPQQTTNKTNKRIDGVERIEMIDCRIDLQNNSNDFENNNENENEKYCMSIVLMTGIFMMRKLNFNPIKPIKHWIEICGYHCHCI